MFVSLFSLAVLETSDAAKQILGHRNTKVHCSDILFYYSKTLFWNIQHVIGKFN